MKNFEKLLKKTSNFYIFKNMYKFIFLVFFFVVYPSHIYLQTVVSQVSSEQQITPAMLLEYETKLEQQRTEYVQKNILDKIFGPGRSTVMIDITLGLKTTTTKQQATAKKVDSKRKLGEPEYLLPGIPKPGSIAESAVPTEAKGEVSGTEVVGVNTEIVIVRQNVTVIYDEKIKDEKVEIARDAIAAALDIKKKESIVFKKAKFTPSLLNKFFENIILPKYLIPLIITLVMLMFLFGPVAYFLKNYIRMLRERSPTEISIDSKLAHEGEPVPAGVGGNVPAELTETPKGEEEKEEVKGEAEEEKYIPFSYVNDDNIQRLKYLLVTEKPENIAVVLSYLKPEYVKEIIESFKPELQAEIAISLAQAREVPQEEVLKLDRYIKERIDFLVGGLHRLIELLKRTDNTTRKSILTYLEHKKPDIYQKVRPHLFLFEDILDLPDLTLQVVIRELKPENIARALRNAPKTLVDKFFKNMSEGAQALVREEIEYGKPLNKEQIEEEQNKILELIKKLEQEGKIYIGEREETFVIDSSEVVVGSSKKALEESPAYEYYIWGVEVYNQKDYQTAISYFQYAVELDKDFYPAYIYLGNIYYELGNYQQALTFYKQAKELNPEDKEFALWVDEFERSISVSSL